jgi:ABC-type multidrug transport system fused ATPase/permease subunit
MKNFNQEDAYSRAKHKVDKLKGFYKHLSVYIIINALIFGMKIIRNLTHGETLSEAFFDIDFYGIWLFWGIGLAFHAFSVFGVVPFFGQNWEENKIKKYMEDDERNVNSNRK